MGVLNGQQLEGFQQRYETWSHQLAQEEMFSNAVFLTNRMESIYTCKEEHGKFRNNNKKCR